MDSMSGSLKRQQRNTAYLMMLPATVILGLFLITPFFMAMGLSLTDQPLVPRLITETNDAGETIQRQEPADFVGLENYQRLLSMQIFEMQPIVDEDTREGVLDEDGNIEYERPRTYLRPAGLEELAQFQLGGTRYLVGASDAKFWFSLRNILQFVIVVVPLQTSFALALAILVNRKLPGMNIFRAVYFSPVVTSMAIVAVVWVFLYNPSSGFLNNALGVIGIGPFDWLDDPRSSMVSIIILSMWQGVGFQMVIFLAGLQEIPESLYEASALDGANRWEQFRFVTLPSLRNTSLFVIISTTILAFKLFTQVDIMTSGGGPANSTITTTLHMVNEGFREAQRVGYASAIAVVFVIIVFSISMIQNRILQEEED